MACDLRREKKDGRKIGITEKYLAWCCFGLVTVGKPKAGEALITSEGGVEGHGSSHDGNVEAAIWRLGCGNGGE